MAQEGVMPQRDAPESSKDEHHEDIWNRRKSGWKIMREARRRLSKDRNHIAFASAHYSLVKLYMNPVWMRFFAIWHMWRASVHAKRGWKTAPGLDTPDRVDVASTILSKAPWWLGGDIVAAENLIRETLLSPNPIVPHTRALLYLSLGNIHKQKENGWNTAVHSFRNALILKNEVLSEADQLMAYRQWTRIVHGVAVQYLEYGIPSDQWGVASYGMTLLDEALKYAQKVSKDQEEKILADAKRFEKMIEAKRAA